MSIKKKPIDNIGILSYIVLMFNKTHKPNIVMPALCGHPACRTKLQRSPDPRLRGDDKVAPPSILGKRTIGKSQQTNGISAPHLKNDKQTRFPNRLYKTTAYDV